MPAVEEGARGDRWVLDGNYSRTQSIVWPRVDTVIWLDYGFLRVFWQLLRRTIRRSGGRKALWGGSQERFRKSLYTIIDAVPRRTAAAVRGAIVSELASHKGKLHTLTYDNGKEMAEHEQITEELGIKVCFAHPYSSWERGVNENTNGLIRQYFPKDRELTGVTRKEVEQAMERLNHRPRKTLGFRTPYEVFLSTHTHLTVALGVESKYIKRTNYMAPL